VMSIVRRAKERGDGATGGSTRSRPPVIDLANSRLTLDFISPSSVILPNRPYIVANFASRRGYICVMVTGGLSACAGHDLERPLARAMDLVRRQNVR
jgi:hypothetical protein